jgi:SAM-dependent methyltransferase
VRRDATADAAATRLDRAVSAALYDRIGIGYAAVRRPDPRWADAIRAAMGDARTVVNVGAGAGAYEPIGPRVVAVEPSAEMRAQRGPSRTVQVAARAEGLPFADRAFEVAMAVLTVHHWKDPRAGLAELSRVADRFVIVTYDMDVQGEFWLTRDYIPQIREAERGRVPSLQTLIGLLGSGEVRVLPVWHDHTDGFMTAFWRRPEAYLDPVRRRSCSAFALTDRRAVDAGIERLRADLHSGVWARRYRHLAEREYIDAGFRLIVGPSTGGRHR